MRWDFRESELFEEISEKKNKGDLVGQGQELDKEIKLPNALGWSEV